MDNKRLGIIIIGIGVLFALAVFALSELSHKTDNAFCIASVKPATVISHISLGIVVAALSLGAYLLIFSKSEKAILDRIEQQTNKETIKNKFEILLLGLGKDEKNVIIAVKEQDGITQHTLGIRTGLHKSKLSIVVTMLEQKGLVQKQKKGKTNQIFLRVKL